MTSPALRPVAGEPPRESVLPPGQHSRALVRMRDGTQQLVWVIAWHETRPEVWRCQLCWGVAGVLWENWYEYDEAKMIPWGATAIRETH